MKNLIFTLAILLVLKTSFSADLDVLITDATGGAGTGSIDLTVSGGIAPFTYSWTGPSGFTATTEDISALDMGTYTVTVTDVYCGVATYSWLVDSVSHIGITEISNSGSIFVYPNPGNSQITISAASPLTNANFYLRNLAGQTVLSQKNLNGNGIIIDISSQANGIYFIEILNDEKLSRIKFVKE